VQNELPCVGDVVSAQADILLTEIPNEKKLEGKEFRLYLYCISPNGIGGTTHGDLADMTHADLSQFTHSQIAELGDVPYVPIPYGKFTVLKCKQENDLYRLTCADRLYFSDATYDSALTFPATSADVVNEICQKLGADTDISEMAAGYLKDKNGVYLTDSDGKRLYFSSWQFAIPKKPVGKTMREMLGYIGAMRGKFIVCDREGTIVQRWYLQDGARSLDFAVDGNESGTNCRISDYELGESVISIRAFVCTVDENTTYTIGLQGSDFARAMEFECPYMTRERLEKVAKAVAVSCYRPCTMTQQLGDPRLDLWDGFTHDGQKLLMLNTDITFDGGLMIDITSEGDTDTETLT
jgi:hypothetical protein